MYPGAKAQTDTRGLERSGPVTGLCSLDHYVVAPTDKKKDIIHLANQYSSRSHDAFPKSVHSYVPDPVSIRIS